MRKVFICLAFLCLTELNIMAQVGIKTDGTQPDNSAMLDLKTTGKGVLLPRMTFQQRNSIPNPVEGLMVFCTNCNPDGSGVLSLFQGGKWKTIDLSCLAPNNPISGTHIPILTQITWNWNPVSGATGYKWNTANDYSTATDMGNSISFPETGLSCGTSYTRYIWAYNPCGHSAGTSLSQATLTCLTCGQPFTDARDGKTYNTLLIGSQCWMKDNLNVGTKIDGASEQTNDSIIEKYCYNNDESNCDIYGGLYQWGELVQYLNGTSNTTSWNPVPTGIVTGICPDGWHLPSDAEWTVLTDGLGGQSIAGGPMKEAGLAHWAAPNTGGTNSSGFTGLPGGERLGYIFGGFYYITTGGYFWSCSENSVIDAWARSLYNDLGMAYRNTPSKLYGFSVRCIKN
jgi:uncharacterized protein (TIGR02145 family)